MEMVCVNVGPTHVCSDWISSDAMWGGEVQWYFFSFLKNCCSNVSVDVNRPIATVVEWSSTEVPKRVLQREIHVGSLPRC
jgi:hypothetical protein